MAGSGRPAARMHRFPSGIQPSRPQVRLPVRCLRIGCCYAQPHAITHYHQDVKKSLISGGDRVKLKHQASMVVLSAVLMLGGSVAMAPTASAVGSSACRFNSPDVNFKVATSGARFRTGPG